MSLTALGSPVQAFVDAVKTTLEADAVLMARIEGVFGHLSEAARTNYPYLVLGRRTRQNDSGAMGIVGGHVSMQLDCWSDHNGASEAHAILSDVARVLERRNVSVAPYALVQGSLTCEFEDVFFEPDENAPDVALYHGVQRWMAEIHDPL